ncbi:MAG: hypothetical protein JSV62_01300 [Promethearchaeota archaeon]|nr:MAG: hypothetical protein JSV62_01300 [Candidatus Lokiarchaeota archaeon]
MKRSSKILLSVFFLVMVFSLVSNVNAIGESDQIVEVDIDSIQTQQLSNVRTTYLFREMTQLTICANVYLDLNINCKASSIKEKDFMLQLEGDNNLQVTMTCTREENQLGLMDGNILRVRNRNMYKYQEGFIIAIECVCGCQCQPECQCICDCECDCINECDCICDCECECLNECQCICTCGDECCFNQARLRIKATNQNMFGKWAYYAEDSGEWVTVPTTIEDGYLTAQVDHFSTWTVLVPISLNLESIMLIIGICACVAVLGIVIRNSAISYKKRK